MTVHPFSSSQPFGPKPWHRPRSWDRQSSPSCPDPWREIAWSFVEELEEILQLPQPFAFLDFAAKLTDQLGDNLQPGLAGLRRSGWYEPAMLATAVEWLKTGLQPHSTLDPDTPKWLRELDQLKVTEAKRQKIDETTAFILGVELPSGRQGAVRVLVDADRDDAITNYFVTDDSAPALARLLEGISNFGGHKQPRYHKAAIDSTMKTLAVGVQQYDANPFELEAMNPWPRNRLLLDFVLQKYQLANL